MEKILGQKILIEIGGLSFTAQLYSGAADRKFAAALPKEFTVTRWGDEYYGNCSISLHEDDTAREIMKVGEIAYWAPDSAFCIFFGSTPASTDSRPRAASEVIPLGLIDGDVSALKSLGTSLSVKIRML
jgi:uncharacterized protein